jgi:hypothetical protein
MTGIPLHLYNHSENNIAVMSKRLYFRGSLDLPGAGIIYVTRLDKAATFVPKEVIDRIGEGAG